MRDRLVLRFLIVVSGLAGCHTPRHPADGPLTQQEGQMAATFTAMESFDVVPFNDVKIAFADINNDGHLDYYNYAAHNLLINTGNESFTSARDLLPGIPSTVTRGAVWGDFDGDSFVDL